ncbi:MULTISPECIES: molybdopterin converting factor subunit 1 [Bacillaceae]|uniref:Molybdopterin synthase sulfur carrier subunit n=1 Tax=Metabacillus endolithicus TaxID=1535204 RepID=A0ABW5BUE3_9BACI|nr:MULTISPECIES: molybdopterin converting factor subunit 1 [Bacillaceae]PGT81708.1 molybdopterin converting factor subunit 1 [Bacillus sp. AFS040349]UGB32454.1 molybdopterin converting factor subunit 1 [Metabacillus sp. B2-18]UPG63071.1 molybdopterin converting factor subunit 1 [Metabacillus endolithicus]
MIKVLLFAHLQEKIGTDNIVIEKNSLTVKELRDFVSQTYEVGSLENVMVAVNEEYALEEDLVQAGDTVAFIPPVSGG